MRCGSRVATGVRPFGAGRAEARGGRRVMLRFGLAVGLGAGRMCRGAQPKSWAVPAVASGSPMKRAGGWRRCQLRLMRIR